MSSFPIKARLSYRLQAKLVSLFGYRKFIRNLPKYSDNANNVELDKAISDQLSGYPRNHDFEVSQGSLIPSFRLYERLRLVLPAMSGSVESFLDIGCCRGFYVMSAARDPSCERAVGVDVHKPFVDLADQVSDHIGLKNTSFHVATLDQIVKDPKTYYAPYQTVLLIGTYHYLFWGSKASSHSFGDHDTILKTLSMLCTKRVILSGRLEVERLPDYIQERAKGTERAKQYTTDNFVQCAQKYFDVKCIGYLGTYPLLQMDKKKS